jgi:hypothetical protein
MRIAEINNYVTMIVISGVLSLSGCNGAFGSLLDRPQPSVVTDSIPPVVSNRILTITDISPSGFTLSWVSALDDVTPQDDLEYRVIFREGGDASSITDPNVLPVDAVVAHDWGRGFTAQGLSGLEEGVSYGVVVFVRDAAGNYASYEFSSAIPVDKIPPVVTSSTITLVSKNDTSVRLSWVAASDNYTSVDDLQYKIVMSQLGPTTSLSAAEALGPANILWDWSAVIDNPYDHLSLQPNTTYHYNVLVRDDNGNVAIYGGISVTTDPDPGDTTPPEIAVGALTIGQGSSVYRATVSWTKATDDVSDQSALEYRLVGALSIIDTPAKFSGAQVLTDAGIGGDGWTTDIDTLSDIPVSDGIVTHFALAVKDEAGNVSYYSPGAYDLTSSRRATLVET